MIMERNIFKLLFQFMSYLITNERIHAYINKLVME